MQIFRENNLESEKLSLLIFDNNSEIVSEFKEYLKGKKTIYNIVNNLQSLDDTLQQKQYDLLICLFDDFTEEMRESIAIIRDEFSTLFICAISAAEAQTDANLDYFAQLNHMESKEALHEFLINMISLAEHQKKQMDLSAMLLHDLRSPVQSILGYLELLEQDVFGSVNDGQKQILRNALSVGDTVIELMNELSLVYQLERNEFHIISTAVLPKEALDETLRSLWIQADKKNIKLIPQVARDLPAISGDIVSIQRVLHNLISNAIKYSPQNGTVRISAKQTDNPAGQKMVSFNVRDSGPGIPPNEIELVFNKFYRLNKPQSITKGQGLGLYIARLIVEAHLGKLGVFNNREGGATFYCTLPVYEKDR